MSVCSERREQDLFSELLRMCPGLRERLLEASEDEVALMADLVNTDSSLSVVLNLCDLLLQIQKGVNGARSDDTKTMKSAIIDWITPPGQTLEPPLNRKIKTTRGFHHERTGALLCPAGLDWSVPQ
jgi:hypothetical protein